MLKVIIDDTDVFEIAQDQINGKTIDWDAIELSKGHFHIIKDGRSIYAELLGHDRESGVFQIKVGNNTYDVQVKDKMALLLEKMGLSTKTSSRVSEIKAPMPGLVIKILAGEGDEVNKDQPVLVLEAMKMENILKSPVAGKVKNIEVKVGQAIEKNQVLLHFE